MNTIALSECDSCRAQVIPMGQGFCPNCQHPMTAAAFAEAKAAKNRPPFAEEVVKRVYLFAAELLKQGTEPNDVEDRLAKEGLNTDAARTVVINLCRMRTRALRNAGVGNIVYGSLWCCGGLAVTYFTLEAARSSPTGGHYLVAYGAVVAGAIQIVTGLAQLLRTLARSPGRPSAEN